MAKGKASKSKGGYIEYRSKKSSTGKGGKKTSRSRSRDTGRARSIGKPKASAAPQRKISLSNYYTLSKKQLAMSGRWMANEDLNIWLYVREHGTSGMKKEEYWRQGFAHNIWRKTKTISSLRNRHRFYVKHLTEANLPAIKSALKTGKIHYINFEFMTANSGPSDPRRMASISTNSAVALPTRGSLPKAKASTSKPTFAATTSLFKQKESYATPKDDSENEWFRISRAYWEQWSKWESDQRLWINLEDRLQGGERPWRMPLERLKISTNFVGDRMIVRQHGRSIATDDDTFITGVLRDYDIAKGDLLAYFAQVSDSRTDLLDYLGSNGNKSFLLWTKDEDEMMSRHYKNPNHNLMKLLTKMKGPERIQSRLSFLGII